jgi:hypothetical protein
MFDTPAKGASYLDSPEEPTIPTGSCSNYKKEHASRIHFKQTREWQSMGDSTGAQVPSTLPGNVFIANFCLITGHEYFQ